MAMKVDDEKVKVGIIGASGYAGAELLRILHVHPYVSVVETFAYRSAGRKLSEVFPHLSTGYSGCELEAYSLERELRADFYFLCVPHGHSHEIVPFLLEQGKRVIDLSADYRFKDSSLFENVYGVKHSSIELLKEAVYGIPELFYEKIAGASLVANPGCLARAAILSLAPLLKDRFIEEESTIVIDAKTGVSGAGRKMRSDLMFSEMNEDMRPYSPVSHRHVPEIEQVAGELSGSKKEIIFVPHIVSIDRGILATCYTRLSPGYTFSEAKKAFTEFYQKSPFVRMLTPENLPSVKRIRGSNLVEIAIVGGKNNNSLIIFSCLDNLVSGASGNAVHCFNVMNQFDEDSGLSTIIPLYP